LQNQRDAFDRGGVSAFAALDEPLLDEPLRIGELSDSLAGVALAAEVVGEAFTICGLGEHACESEFTHSARAGEEQGVGNALATEGAAERGNYALVAEKFREAHGLRILARGDS
jgi:hypothetical protein